MEAEEAKRMHEERKEYVKNIGIEYKFGCYEEKRADSCHLLAEYFEAIDLNFKSAFELLKKNCLEKEYSKSCFKYGMYILSGKECTPSLKDMIKPMQIACDGGIRQGCRYLSLVYWNGEKDRPADSKKAEEYMKKACEMEDGEACWLLSTWYMGKKEKFLNAKAEESDRVPLGSLERNMEKSLLYGTKACEFDVPHSCANVARMYNIGDGIEKNPDKAKIYLNKAKEAMEALKNKENSAGFTG